MRQVSRLLRYPVKSALGEDLTRLDVGPQGVLGDRAYAFVAADGSEVLSAKRTAPLLEVEARHQGEGVEIRLPGGDWQAAPSDELDAAASAWLDRPVRVAAPVSGAALPFRMSFDLDDEDKDVFEWAGPEGTFLDLAAVHLLTTASLRAAEALHPEGAWVVERFRPNVVVDVDDAEGFVEDDWVGRRLALGEVELDVLMPTIRCPMPTRPQGDLPRDLDIVKTLNHEHDGNLGVYCSVATPGVIAMGAEVRLL